MYSTEIKPGTDWYPPYLLSSNLPAITKQTRANQLPTIPRKSSWKPTVFRCSPGEQQSINQASAALQSKQNQEPLTNYCYKKFSRFQHKNIGLIYSLFNSGFFFLAFTSIHHMIVIFNLIHLFLTFPLHTIRSLPRKTSGKLCFFDIFRFYKSGNTENRWANVLLVQNLDKNKNQTSSMSLPSLFSLCCWISCESFEYWSIENVRSRQELQQLQRCWWRWNQFDSSRFLWDEVSAYH